MNDSHREFATLDKNERTFTFCFREGFGNGRDDNGILIATADAELEQARKIFNEAIDMMIGRRQSVVSVERWVRLRMSQPLPDKKSVIS